MTLTLLASLWNVNCFQAVPHVRCAGQTYGLHTVKPHYCRITLSLIHIYGAVTDYPAMLSCLGPKFAEFGVRPAGREGNLS